MSLADISSDASSDHSSDDQMLSTSHDTPPHCSLCHLLGHAEDSCTACKICCRLGHQKYDCPYIDYDNDNPIYCSNCGDKHPCAECSVGCQVEDCNFWERTWLHPHVHSDMPAVNKAWVHGYAPAMSSSDAPKSTVTKAINMSNQIPHQDRPFTPFASYQGPTDTTFLTQDTQETSVVTNYVTVTPKIISVFVYSMVMIDRPAALSVNLQRTERENVFAALCEKQPLQGRDDFSTDFETLWVGSALQGPLAFDKVAYRGQNGQAAEMQRVEFKYLRRLDFSHGTADLAGAARTYRNPNELKRAVNGMVTRSVMSKNQDKLYQHGTNDLFIKSKSSQPDVDWNNKPVYNALHIQRGYSASLQPGTESVLLNIDILHDTFLKPMIVSELVDEMEAHVEDAYGDDDDYLQGCTMRIMYDRPSLVGGIDMNAEVNRIKTICDSGEVPQVQQFERDGKMWSVKEWFETQGININRVDLVCFNVGTTYEPYWVPAELLELMPDQAFGEKLGVKHMKIMSDTADQHPAMNHIAIQEKGLALLESGGLDRSIFLDVGKSLLQVPATFLTAPTIEYHDGAQKQVENASWDMDDVHFTKPAMLIDSKLCVLDFRDPEPKVSPGRFAQLWMESCESHGLLAPGWTIEPDEAENVTSTQAILPSKKSDGKSYFSEMQQIIETFRDSLDEPQFVVVLLPEFDAKAHAAIKRVCDVKLGVHTICCIASDLAEEELEPFDRMSLEQNLKAPNGRNHAVTNEGESAFADLGETTLVIGVDVIHAGGDTPSIVAMVGSTHSDFATFTGRVRLQSAQQEALDQDTARVMVQDCIFKWKQAHPKDELCRIIYYRGGVGEDQYDIVIENEIGAIEEAIISATTGFDEVAITAIVVSNRHHTSFFAPNDSMTYEDENGHDSQPPRTRKLNGNIKPGLLVDSVITQPSSSDFQDFFLQSHTAATGTARPAHYTVLRNDIQSSLTLQQLQVLTHAFCYNNAVDTKALAYCSPVYYANRLCDRALQYMNSYLSAEKPRLTQLTDESLVAFRSRIRDHIAGDPEWMQEGRTNPWHEAMDGVMFWL